MLQAGPPASPVASTAATPRPLSGLVLSIGFWSCLASAAVLFGAVSLAPRIVERERFEQVQAQRQGELLTLQQEVQHLERVAAGLTADSRLAGSIARHELQQSPVGLQAVPLAGRLRHDPRQSRPDPIDVAYEEPVYLPLLQSLAASPERRLRWSLLAAGLLMFGFVFLHEHAGSRAVGRVLRVPVAWLGKRYAAASATRGAG